jgi:hypothetical protein
MHLDGLVGGRGALQGEAQQVHPGQAGLGVGLVGEDGLVADHDAVLVRAHLGAPHPERA